MRVGIRRVGRCLMEGVTQHRTLRVQSYGMRMAVVQEHLLTSHSITGQQIFARTFPTRSVHIWVTPLRALPTLFRCRWVITGWITKRFIGTRLIIQLLGSTLFSTL